MDQPASLLRPGWRESRRTINGVSLHLVEAGRPGDPLLILLHGFPEFWWAWRAQLTPLAEAGYHVIAPDMRGYNQSEAPEGLAAYALDTLAADVVGIADAYGAVRCHLVAHDWGAVIGWWVAARHADRLDRVVLMNGPHPDVWATQMARHPTQALRSSYVAFFQLPWVPEAAMSAFGFAGPRTMLQTNARPGTFTPDMLDHYVEAWRQPGALTAMLNYYRALRLRPMGGTPTRITPPTLVLWGDQDSFLERHLAEASVALCERGRLDIVDGATHWLHHEQPDRVTAAIRDWLAGEADTNGPAAS